MGVNLTKPFRKVFDAVRIVIQEDNKASLYLWTDKNVLIAEIKEGYLREEVTDENNGGEVTLISITHRPGIEFRSAVFFELEGYKYERQGAAHPPTGNPKLWKWTCKPVSFPSNV